nr:MAG TPA: regulatory protein [Caudoviricetes sp.]
MLLSNKNVDERSNRMYELSVFQQGGVDVIDSRSVAEAIGKDHRHLIRDIRNYAEVIEKSTEPNFGLSDFFIPHTYTDSTGRTLPCYLLTKKGCDMVANKMTGEKGVLFTAAYVTAFEKMRQQTQKPMTTNEMFAMQAQINLESERKLAALEGKVDETNRKFDAVTTFVTSPLTDADTWQERMTRHIRRAVEEFGLNYQQFHAQLYDELERTAGVDLKCRQTRMRNRLYAAGATKTECKAVSKLSVVAADKKLRAMFETILRNEIVRLATSRSVAI